MVACRESNATIDIIKILLKYKCDVFATSTNGYTAIHAAAAHGSHQRIEVIYNHLLNMTNPKYDKSKIDELFNQQTKKDKETAYHKAARNGHTEVIETLLKLCKVDFEIENVDGRKARDLYCSLMDDKNEKQQWLRDLERVTSQQQ